VTEAKSRLQDAGLARPDSFQGCTEQEINALDGRFCVSLPECYRDFLATMGRSAGEFLVGTDYAFPHLLEFRTRAERLLKSSQSNFALSPTTFVFAFHQGYTFLFFHCDGEHDDPPVFLFTEEEAQPRKVSDSFAAWLRAAVDDDITLYQEMKRN
jgi:hypothetical protein